MGLLLMRRYLATVVVVSAAGTLSACGPSCDDFAGSSLVVRVQDATTHTPICDAHVSAEHGGETKPLRASGGSPCAFSFGFLEVSGHFVITVTREGYVPATKELDVAKGECHVEEQHVTIALTPA